MKVSSEFEFISNLLKIERNKENNNDIIINNVVTIVVVDTYQSQLSFANGYGNIFNDDDDDDDDDDAIEIHRSL